MGRARASSSLGSGLGFELWLGVEVALGLATDGLGVWLSPGPGV